MNELPLIYATAAWGIASALAVTVLGLLSLRGGSSRPRGAVAFGLFAIAWGVQVALGNGVIFSGHSSATVLLRFASIAFHLPVIFYLVEFSASQAPRRTWVWNVIRAISAILVLAAAFLLATVPELLVGGAQLRSDGGWSFTRGVLYFPLIIVPYFAAFGLALVGLHQAHLAAPTPRTARRAATLLAGIGTYTAFAAGNNVTYYAGSIARFSQPLDVAYTCLFLSLLAIAVSVATQNLRASKLARVPDEVRRHRLLAATLILPATWGAIEGWLALDVLLYFETVGLWRLVGVGIIAYGLARWRLFDLPQRATRTAATAAGASGSIATGAAAYGLGTLVTTSIALPAFAGLAVVGATFIPGVRLARRIFSALTKADEASDADAMYGQRVDAYRAALENAYARRTVEEDSEFLDALREKFGISEGEDRLLRYYARSAVLVPREGDAGAVYERLRLLGEGGAGRTWLARDRVRDRLVVLKEPLHAWQREPAVRESVLREARMAARVRHPNVITVEEVVEDKGMPVIVMEFMDGGSLADHLRTKGILPWREAVEMVVQVARGVESIHANGIVHRDLKPSNVLLTNGNTPKVADFGIAIPSSTSKTVVDGSTSFAGTLAYVSPEVRLGAIGDKRSDVYALGAILHECLYGSPPGPHAPVLANNEVPPALSRTLARALAEVPDARQPTARAFVEELMAVIRE